MYTLFLPQGVAIEVIVALRAAVTDTIISFFQYVPTTKFCVKGSQCCTW